MELIKRIVSLEEVTDRRFPDPITGESTWGEILTTNTFHIKVFLTQNVDDMGIFTDAEFVNKSVSNSEPNYDILETKLRALGINDFTFMTVGTQAPLANLTPTDLKVLRLPINDVSRYYVTGGLMITGLTESKLDDVKSYSNANPYQQNFVINQDTYTAYNGTTVIGVDKIVLMSEPKIYVFDCTNTQNLATSNTIEGLRYLEYTGITRETIIKGVRTTIPTTIFNYLGQGWNATNTSLSALTKEEYLFGVVSRPEVENDVFIDRGQTNVLDLHLKLSEITNMDELTRYGNGYYKINKQ